MANLGLDEVDVDSLLKMPPRAKNVRKPTKSKTTHDIVANPMTFGKKTLSTHTYNVVTVFFLDFRFLKISKAPEDLGSFANFGAPGSRFLFYLSFQIINLADLFVCYILGQFELVPSHLETQLFDVKEFELRDDDNE